LLAPLVLCVAPAAHGVESRVCGTCHREIYATYMRTPMARSSGAVDAAAERLENAAFDAGGFRYKLSRNRGGLFVEFARQDGTLHGSKRLAYFIGSGATARSYAIADDGYLFEAPVANYGIAWRLAPGYQTYAYPYLTRPIAAACLNCHASELAPVALTQNRYGTPPFGEGGIACERCHGAGEAHARDPRESIVNPAKLDAERRDSVCAQCHLAGEVRVMRAGRDWRSYRPGERLADSVAVFVRAGGTAGMKVTSHMEKLAQSACKRAARERLWCGTCHDPHGPPDAAAIRQKCLACHAASPCKETAAVRAAKGDDCVRCHMPKSTVTDAQHVVYTDHSIPRRPRPGEVPPHSDADLEAFGGAPASARDLALAYGIAAGRTRAADDQARALEMLKAAERNSPDDVEVLLYLAEVYRGRDEYDLAIPLYRKAIRLDPAQVTASVGLGGIMMERGELAEATRLWQDALAKNSGLELVRTNMAMAQWKSGDLDGARRSLEKAMEMNPGFAAPAELLERLHR
jgi:hypothetical protein